ncbi:MAG: single-stranded DNA-binding protein [Candidatus Gracilibacteria bacterium]|jgi:single-strand DNA-binding protein|nr:single-stranded DNA-binding protein [Candidatus Gracilibacteria bacterium]
MRSINKVIIIGNLTRDPEMRSTPNGQTVTTFGIATNREWITKDGEKKNSAEFHECVAWARLAEICSSHLKKGRLVYIEGYLKTRNWDKDGQRKFKTEIVVQDMVMLEKKGSEEDYVPETMAEPPFYGEEESFEAKPEESVKEPEEKHQEAEKVDEAKTQEPEKENEENEGQSLVDKDLGL